MRVILFLLATILAVGWASETHAFQVEYNFNQRIISLECVESEVDSGGAINRDLYPEHCWRSPGAPALPDEPIPKERASKSDEIVAGSGQLAETGSPIYYLLALSLLATGGVILLMQKRVRLLIFYHKHDNIEVLDHKNKK